jgi:chromosome segregation ATPase
VDEAYNRDMVQRNALAERRTELEGQKKDRQYDLHMRQSKLHEYEKEPSRLQRQISSIKVAQADMHLEQKQLDVRLRAFEVEQEEQVKRRQDAEKLRTRVLETLELNRQTLEDGSRTWLP